MSALDDILKEEYERLLRMQNAFESERAELPAGYITKKKINGKEYYYIQKREGDKIKSQYIPFVILEDMKKKVERRKQLESSLKEIKQSLKKIKRVIS